MCGPKYAYCNVLRFVGSMRVRLGGIVPLALLLACGGSGSRVNTAETGAFRATGVGAALDPTVKNARLLPETVDEGAVTYGTESGGGVRAITAGLRVVAARDGAILAAEDRLPQGPQITTPLPERLGGGFLFVLGPTVWRADRWLGPATPIFTSGQQQSIQAIVPGLDRVYIKTLSSYLAIDGKTGKVLDLGPWPASPYVSAYAAADGWRAAAVTDLRGVVATSDAGATWRTLDLPLEPRTVLRTGESLAIGGVENGGRNEAWFEVRADGSVARLGGAPPEAKGKLMPSPSASTRYPYGYGGYGSYPVPPPYPQPYGSGYAPSPKPDANATKDDEPKEAPPEAGVKIFGKRPLAAAIEDGWPLTDGTAVVARDGALGRVRLSDGALTELVQGAYPMKPSRCHPVSLTRPNAVGAFGFVCGEPRGTTAIYAYEPLRGRLSEIKRFDKPRVVTSSGNGALAVRGSCAEDADAPSAPRVEPLKVETKDKDKDKDAKDKDKKKGRTVDDDDDDDEPKKDDKKSGTTKPVSSAPVGLSPLAPAPEVRPYCVLGHDNVWREVHVRGDVGGERVVVLADGKIAVVSPPQSTSAPARLTILDKGKATTVAVTFPKVTTDVARVLRLGLWLDGFEERKPGVVGGWIEARGAMLGIEIAPDGKASLGQYHSEGGNTFVSGKYGLEWFASRRGAETTDGGMTWTPIDLPDPLASRDKVERRACGPIGCVANGWMRVGWGEQKKAKVPDAPPPYRAQASVSTPHLALSCEPVAGQPPTPAAPKAPKPAAHETPQATRPRPYGGPPVLGGFNGVTEFPAFFGFAGPPLRDSDRGLPIDIRDLPERYPTMGQLGKIYAWGPKTGDWDSLGRWQVRWVSPFTGWNEVKVSVPVLPPQAIVDFTRSSSPYSYGGYYGGYAGQFQLVPGDDAAHALLVGRRTMRNNEIVLFELEGDRAPVELRRMDGEPFGEIEAYVRAAGRWFFATPVYSPTAAPATAIWQVDGAVARELVRIPRAGLGEGGRSAQSKLARRSDGRAIGLVVDGQQPADRQTAIRWVLPIDVDSGQLGEPEPLGFNDLAGRVLDACSDDLVGWVLDAPLVLGSNIRVKLPAGTGSIHSAYGRVRLTSSRACVERIAGTYDGQSTERAAQLTRGAAGAKGNVSLKPGELIATAMSAQNRYALKCTVTK